MLELKKVSFKYDSEFILNDFSLTVKEGEIVGLLGESGSGKSTILRMIAGLETPSSGNIYFDGECITNKPVHHRGFGYIFQSFALFPHLNVYKNIAFGISGLSKNEVDQKVRSVAKTLKIDDLLKRYPHELSGGQKQRVAIGRSLVTNPRLILFDEPFSALDKDLRVELRIEIREILEKNNISAVLVSHDIDDVNTICNKVIKIKKTASN